ncbi:hypothetical protein AVEN_211375-1, partial [Araneus ventricosus]
LVSDDTFGSSNLLKRQKGMERWAVDRRPWSRTYRGSDEDLRSDTRSPQQG